MVRSVQHAMLATPTVDEAARQQFAVAFKQFLNREVRSKNEQVFREDAAPAPETRPSIFALPRTR